MASAKQITRTYWPSLSFVVKTFIAGIAIGLVALIPVIGKYVQRLWTSPAATATDALNKIKS